MEADQWIVALHQAMVLGGSKKVQNSCDELARFDSLTVTSSRPTTAGSFSSSSLTQTNCSEESTSPPPIMRRDGPQEPTNPAEAYVRSLQTDAKTSTSAMLPPRVPKRPTAAKTKKEETAAQEEGSCSRQKTIQQDKVAAQARQATDVVTEYSAADATLEDGNEAWGVVQPQKVSQTLPRYSDQAAGLSMQQRLAQLDFSDDEDDCEEEQAQHDCEEIREQAAATDSQAVTVEYCQPFTAALSDSDED